MLADIDQVAARTLADIDQAAADSNFVADIVVAAELAADTAAADIVR